MPALHVCCGEQDEPVEGNRAFLEACAAASVPVTTDVGPGTHEWAYWDARIQDVLDWLPLRGTGR